MFDPYNEISKIVMRGAKIYNLKIELETFIDNSRSLISVAEDFINEENEEEVRKECMIWQAQTLAYENLLEVLKEEFNFDIHTEKEFREKKFKGAKLASIINYVTKKIKEKEREISLIKEIPICKSEDIILFIEAQKKNYEELLNQIRISFIKNSKREFPLFESWIEEFYKSEG